MVECEVDSVRPAGRDGVGAPKTGGKQKREFARNANRIKSNCATEAEVRIVTMANDVDDWSRVGQRQQKIHGRRKCRGFAVGTMVFAIAIAYADRNESSTSMKTP